ncbi:kinase-like domain-containing protein [Echria macrotheca]|uniref:non-specific serine/threonine protein kinase n=1 Tax=Echria macrotheca TaxID=438768 RepID=A0AAJ0BHV1_9PEZI|nr:kinase-like domain-containing protein [Echria macrotheca]
MHIAHAVKNPSPRYTIGYATVSPDGTLKKQEKHQIGPWSLGEVLGEGSSARVRKGQHRITGQMAAVKIVPKTLVHLTQAGSLADLDKIDVRMAATRPCDGTYRMPVAIEREVAILKLVQHPNILQLLDLWENRHDIYLVTEFVENGDLFDYINWHGPIAEEEAMWYFRQIMAAIDYCHSLNICHRDLKPENILLKGDGTIKIADFGMAALHQNNSHRLRTACGSPHYAAPELLRHQHYQGSTVDIWSMGVILYAMLCGCQPFDDEDVETMLRKAMRAEYELPHFLSPDAQDLISKILVAQPAQRITMKQMWNHPLVRKYSYLDNRHLGQSLPGNISRNTNVEPIPTDEIDPQLLRQLTTLWHSYSEKHLVAKLQQQGPNDQKLFYWLLYQHRQNHLENLNTGYMFSKTDFHHFRAPRNTVFTKRVATCHFADEGENGDGPAKGGTKFTVVSEVPEGSDVEEDDAKSMKSYDPYNSSRILQPDTPPDSHAKVTVHRDDENDNASTVNGSFQKLPSEATITKMKPQDSAASSTTTSHSNARVVARSRTKRQVEFSGARTGKPHSRRRSKEAAGYLRAAVIDPKPTNAMDPVRPQTIPETDPKQVIKPQHESRARKEIPKPVEVPKREFSGVPRADSEIWNAELQKYSILVAEDCDKAFQSSGVFAESADGSSREGSPFSLTFDAASIPQSTSPRLELPNLNPERSSYPWADRPLPPTPPATDSPVQGRHFSANINPLPLNLSKPDERRAVSQPTRVESKANGYRSYHLPPINETNRPPKTPTAVENQGLVAFGAADKTIRVVNSPTAPVPVPAPLNVRKVSQKNPHAPAPLALTAVRQAREKAIADRQSRELGQCRSDESKNRVEEVAAALEQEQQKRRSRVLSDTKEASKTGKQRDSKASSSHVSEENNLKKKKSFRFTFPLWKKEKDTESVRMSLIVNIWRDDDNGSQDGGYRKIEVHQNWLFRLLRVKPAQRHICFAIPRHRSRQELAIQLRQWRRFGIRDVEVDKERSIVWARLDESNYLDLKGVSFAIQISTIIEHGKGGRPNKHYAIARCTQERGAASSFHRVVDALIREFLSRGLLISEKRKIAMMVQTLKAVHETD